MSHCSTATPQDNNVNDTEEPLKKRIKIDHNGDEKKMSSSAMEVTATAEVDEKLYSRQLYVMGHEAQRRMMASHALLIGASGLGAEVAKNCILAGISSITLCDPNPANSFDLGGNFYLKEADVGSSSSRAELCKGKLAELNKYVSVKVADMPSLEKEAILNLVDGMSVVVITIPLPTDILHAINEKCREVNASFIYTLSTGLFGKVFCDFGKDFVVSDKDGENPASSQVENIIASNPAVVKVLEDQGRHGLETGDFVTFSRVKGLDGLIDEKSRQYEVKVTGPYTFELVGCDFSAASSPATQGYITQVKKPVSMSFKTYADALEDPGELMMSDFAKSDRPPILHLAYKALALYSEKNALQYPQPGDDNAAQQVLDLAKSIDSDNILDGNAAAERIILHLASGSRSILSPMCAALGGIVGQELLKACSGKFTPINGFLYFDADECLPEKLLPQTEVSPTGSRYDSQIAVFGKTAQQKLLDLNYFLVGAGAIGCEMLKNWALMGVGCGEKGHIHITDMDRIEKSNLSRQFLFRDDDISEFKSSTAARAAKVMNTDMNISDYVEKVGSDTEHLFGDDFYDKLDGVCTALDNVEARLYVDQRCLFYRLPMLESGTLGTKGNTQVVVPHLTENYGATRDPPEKSIPVCTLKNFPNQIQHTLQWARDYFEGEFKQSAEDVNSYLASPNFAETLAKEQNTKLDTVKSIRRTLVAERPTRFEDCVVWARLKFEELFKNQISQLLHNFPEDQVTSTGTKFWSGSKRCPKPLAFDLYSKCEDAGMRNHFDFIVAAANLRASMFGIKGRNDEEYFSDVLNNVIVPDFVPKAGVKIASNESEAKEEAEVTNRGGEMDVDTECEEILNELPKQSELAGFQLTPVDFDKDIDEHMLFVTACSNLRALNYSIPTEDTHRSRAIAGRIIPAIATTTALVTGLICLELYKITGTSQKELQLDALKNGFVNLAIPFMTLSEPTAPAKTKAILEGKEWNWTAWDSLDFNMGDITLQEFLDIFEQKYRLDVSMLSYNVSILFSFFANRKKVEERKKMKMSEVVTSVSKKQLPPNQLFIILEVIANDLDTDEEVELPYVKFRFR
uniref:E1 ubiquitin-activating enzyme n=1 Tax=Ditylum brightwellii TaxID=49249 RepID=A0A7S4R5V0_9STRA